MSFILGFITTVIFLVGVIGSGVEGGLEYFDNDTSNVWWVFFLIMFVLWSISLFIS